MPTDRKAIVIGTGVGGLTAAAYLAKFGLRVLALEQAAKPGGLLNPFQRGSYVFAPGVHYVGECRAGQVIDSVLEGLELDTAELFCELDPDGFDVYRFPDFEVRMCRGLDAYRDRLASLFPGERRGLDRLFRMVHQYGELAYELRAGNWSWPPKRPLKRLSMLPSLLRWGNRTFGSLLQWAINDPRLRAVLAAACGDYGLPPSRASAVFGLALIYHYRDGAFFPRGGSGRLRDALVAKAKDQGAMFRCNADVAQIRTKNGKAVGVELADGERLDCDLVVSNVDPTMTYGQMVGTDVLPGSLRRKIARTLPSLSAFWAFLGLRGDLRAHGLGAFNVWEYPSWDIDALYRPILEGRIPDSNMLFISPNSLKNDSHALSPRECSTLEVVTFVPYEPFDRWRGTAPGERGADYETFKTNLGETLLRQLDERWPGLLEHIETKEFATPLTADFYTRPVKGGVYGPAVTPNQVGPRRFATRGPIANLYLAGAGVIGDGVAPCMLSGQLAAAAAREHAA